MAATGDTRPARRSPARLTGMEVYRTPDSAFDHLPDFPWEPSYAEVADPDGGSLRVAYIDAGPADGPVALLLHGEPSWSFLYRHVIEVLTSRGIRCVVPDLVGFGRSDKPLATEDYSFARLVEWTRELVFDHLDPRDVTLVGQDWGGLIGLRLVAEHQDRFARVVAANTRTPDRRLRHAGDLVAVPECGGERRDARRGSARRSGLRATDGRRRTGGVRRSVP